MIQLLEQEVFLGEFSSKVRRGRAKGGSLEEKSKSEGLDGPERLVGIFEESVNAAKVALQTAPTGPH